MTFFMPYGRDGSTSIGVECPYYRFSLVYRSMGTIAAITLAILLCFDLFGFDEHFMFSVRCYVYKTMKDEKKDKIFNKKRSLSVLLHSA